MGKQKHNWSALKTEFVTGEINNIAEFARIHDIPHNTIIKHQKGWVQEQATFRQQVHNEIKVDEATEKVLSARKRKEYLSEYISGAVEQWKRLRKKLAEVEEAMEGQAPNMRMLQELRRAYSAETKILPDLLRAMELLDGGATSRTDTVIKGKHTKDMSYEELEEAERELAKEILEDGKKEEK